MASENHWFGGPLSAPKVYDTGTNFNAPPTVRGGESLASNSMPQSESGRRVLYKSTDDGWDIVFDDE